MVDRMTGRQVQRSVKVQGQARHRHGSSCTPRAFAHVKVQGSVEFSVMTGSVEFSVMTGSVEFSVLRLAMHTLRSFFCPSARVPVFWCFSVNVAMAERYNALVTVTRLVGMHPKLGDLRDS